MKVAVYTRKSVFAENSDSVKNQDRMCREYIKLHFPETPENFLNYEDEDYTGANTNRPALKRMMKDIEAGIIDFLIVYQLDRLSRDVKDFSNIYSFLETHNVGFISVKENIDTNTPLGKAMMYVSVVFAQMERETIANRVLDNMVGLSGDGWWVGGNPPRGYRRIKVFENGKKHTSIEPVPEEAENIVRFFKIFHENNFSLQNMESYLKHHGIRSQNDKFLSSTQIYSILTTPYCAPATIEIFDYYQAKGCEMIEPRENWTGEFGVMIYGRTSERSGKHQQQPPNLWRVGIGKHKPFMDAKLWLSVQNSFSHNVFNKKMKYPTTLLKGTLRCKCGRLMGLARRKRKNGDVSTWYICPKSNRLGREFCDMHQIKAELIDNKVIDIFKKIEHDPSLIYEYIENYSEDSISASRTQIERDIKNIEKKLSNLATALSGNNSSTASKYIIREIETLDQKLSLKNRELASLQANELLKAENEKRAAIKSKEISNLIQNFDDFTPDEKNAIAKKCIKKCVWDGETLFLTL